MKNDVGMAGDESIRKITKNIVNENEQRATTKILIATEADTNLFSFFFSKLGIDDCIKRIYAAVAIDKQGKNW